MSDLWYGEIIGQQYGVVPVSIRKDLWPGQFRACWGCDASIKGVNGSPRCRVANMDETGRMYCVADIHGVVAHGIWIPVVENNRGKA